MLPICSVIELRTTGGIAGCVLVDILSDYLRRSFGMNQVLKVWCPGQAKRVLCDGLDARI